MLRSLLAATAASALTFAAAPVAQAQDTFEIEDLFKLRGVGQAVMSPDGQTVAYTLSRMPNVLDGEKNGTAMSEVRVLRGGEDKVYLTEDARAGGLSLRDDALLYLADHDGDRALHRLPLSGGAAEAVFVHDGDISRYAMSDDGNTLYFTARDAADDAEAARRKKGFDANVIGEPDRYTGLYRVDLTADAPEAVKLSVEGQLSTLAVSADGSLVAVGVAASPLVADDIIGKKIKVLDGRTGRVLRTADTQGKVGGFAFSPSGEHLAFLAGTGRHDASAHTVAVMNLITGEAQFLTGEDDADEVDMVWVSDDAMHVLAHKGTGSEHYRLSVDGEVSGRRAHEGFVVRGIDGGANGIAATAEAPTHPAALFTTDADGALTKRTMHNEWLKDRRLGTQRVVTYEAADGLEVEGILIEPVQQRRRRRGGAPTIAVVHGGPESHYVNGWLTGYSTPGQFAAGDGYAVFYPNYRGSTGRGQAFAALDHDNPPAAEFDDVVDGIDHLIEEGVTDGDRVGITGGSYGGYASAWGATKLTDRFGASVVFVALTDLNSFMDTTDIPEEMVDSHFRSSPEDEPEMYTEQSPVTHAAQSTTPTLILHGEADPRVHPSQSLQLYRAMKRLTDTPVRLVTYPGEGHGNRKAAGQYDYAHRAMRWFDTYLKTGDRDAPLPPKSVAAITEMGSGSAD